MCVTDSLSPNCKILSATCEVVFDMVWWIFNGSKSWWNKPNESIVFFLFTKVVKNRFISPKFEPLKIHQTILNSKQFTRHCIWWKWINQVQKRTIFEALNIWKSLTTISVGFRYFPKLSRYLYDHKAIKLAARYHKFEIKQFLCLSIFIFYRRNIT